jgi:hypothetical protein
MMQPLRFFQPLTALLAVRGTGLLDLRFDGLEVEARRQAISRRVSAHACDSSFSFAQAPLRIAPVELSSFHNFVQSVGCPPGLKIPLRPKKPRRIATAGRVTSALGPLPELRRGALTGHNRKLRGVP